MNNTSWKRRPAGRLQWWLWLSILWLSLVANGAEVVPIEVQMPGTQPGEIGNLESPDKCDNCHQADSP